MQSDGGNHLVVNNQGLQLLQQAKTAIKANRKGEGRRLLQQSLQADPNNYATWLWLSSVSTSPKQAATYIAQAEKLRPGHPSIKKARVWINKRLAEPQDEGETAVSPSPTKTTNLSTARRRWQWQTAVIRSSLVFVMVLLLAGSGWVFWQWAAAGNGEPTIALAQADQAIPVVSQANNESESITTPPLIPTTTPTAIQIAAKNIGQQSQPRATWTVTPIPSPTPLPTPTVAPTFVSQSYSSSKRPFNVGDTERWIDIDLTTQTLTAFEGDTAVFSTLISSGTREYPTVTGQFRVWLRYQSQTMDGTRLGYDYYLENVPYVMYFFEDYAIHGAYWHNNFGNPMSHGCVNVEPNDAEWLYGWASEGTLVNVH